MILSRRGFLRLVGITTAAIWVPRLWTPGPPDGIPVYQYRRGADRLLLGFNWLDPDGDTFLIDLGRGGKTGPYRIEVIRTIDHDRPGPILSDVFEAKVNPPLRRRPLPRRGGGPASDALL